MKKILSSTAKIRFQDCDPFQHLNNSKYLDYIINAREDQLKEEYGFDIFGLAQKENLSWVVTEHQIAYFFPAGVMEEVVIETQLIDRSNKWVKIEGRMYDKHKRHLKALMWTKLTHIDLKQQKSIPHTSEMNELFQNVELPVEEQSFKGRKETMLNALV